MISTFYQFPSYNKHFAIIICRFQLIY